MIEELIASPTVIELEGTKKIFKLFGMEVVSNPAVPDGEIHVVADGKVIGRIHDIEPTP